MAGNKKSSGFIDLYLKAYNLASAFG